LFGSETSPQNKKQGFQGRGGGGEECSAESRHYVAQNDVDKGDLVGTSYPIRKRESHQNIKDSSLIRLRGKEG